MNTPTDNSVDLDITETQVQVDKALDGLVACFLAVPYGSPELANKIAERTTRAADVIRSLIARVRELEQEAKEEQASFDLRWDAYQRAIKMWHAAHPDRGYVWPDHADMVVWLLEQLAAANERIQSAERERDELRKALLGVRQLISSNYAGVGEQVKSQQMTDARHVIESALAASPADTEGRAKP